MREFIDERGDEAFHGAELERLQTHVDAYYVIHFSHNKKKHLISHSEMDAHRCNTWLSIPNISNMEKKSMAQRGEMGSCVTASG